MNRAVVIRAAAGLTAYLKSLDPEPFVGRGGYDARTNSDVFAHDTCAVVVGHGRARAWCCPTRCRRPCSPTPIRYLGADAGVMVTASHNPPEDNGYKVYLGDGSQIVPPVDAAIAAADPAVARRAACRLAARLVETPRRVGRRRVHRRAAAAVGTRRPPRSRDGRAHRDARGRVGDGAPSALVPAPGTPRRRSSRRRSSPTPRSRRSRSRTPRSRARWTCRARGPRERRRPRSSSRTTPTPTGCAVAIPDAPPAAAAARGQRGRRAARLAVAGAAAGVAPDSADGALACSIVSSPALGAMAAPMGCDYEETLTGFKWISPGARACASATRRRSATASTRRACATRTACRRRLLVAELVATLRPRAARSPTGSTTSPCEHGSTRRDAFSVRVDGPLAHRPDHGAAARRAARPWPASTSCGPTTSPGVTAACRRPRGCATTSPTTPG